MNRESLSQANAMSVPIRALLWIEDVLFCLGLVLQRFTLIIWKTIFWRAHDQGFRLRNDLVCNDFAIHYVRIRAHSLLTHCWMNKEWRDAFLAMPRHSLGNMLKLFLAKSLSDILIFTYFFAFPLTTVSALAFCIQTHCHCASASVRRL